MKYNDIFKLSFYSIKKNRIQLIISSIIFLFLSILFMFIIYIGISLSNNLDNAFEEYIKENQISIFIDQKKSNEQIKKLLSNTKITEMSSVESNSSNICFYDFRLDSHPFDSEQTIEPNTNGVLLSNSMMSEYDINQPILIKENQYIIKGFFSSDSNYDYIVDINYSIDIFDFDSLTINYNYQQGDNINKKINMIESISKDVRKIFDKDSIRMESIDLYLNTKNHSNVLLIICIFISLVAFVTGFALIHNSISIYIDQSKKIIFLFNMYGAKKRDISIYVLNQLIIPMIIGVGVSSVSILVMSPMFKNIGKIFIELIDNGLYSSINTTLKYNYSFMWYIPVITALLYLLACYIDIHISVSKIKNTELIKQIK